MAKHIFYNVSAVVDGADLSDHLESAELIVRTNAQRADAVTDEQEYSMPGKQVVGQPRLNFYQDYAAAKVYATLFAAWQARSTFDVVMKNDAGAVSATNPSWTLTVFVAEMPILAGTQGERHMAPVVLEPAGALAVAIA